MMRVCIHTFDDLYEIEQREKQLNGHKPKYVPLVEIPLELLPQDTKPKPPVKGPQLEEAGFLLDRVKS